MPNYSYRCNRCGDFEHFQHMNESSLSTCPMCDGLVLKIFSSVGVQFKGSGFYSTDKGK